ncbi:hypothetical protein MU638_21650 [Salmonella enterica subsp. enterica serovar Enteritidis]|nr:hypothetical protein [Salmonella enterica subsp. enterica serovar Enteritidis]MCL8953297.1 hypothetical protein [Salmonella enterica subsp. enterica serovar Enteritidis]
MPLGKQGGYPHYREGANGVVCEIEAEYPLLNTHSGVAWTQLDKLNSYTIKKNQSLIDHIDNAVAELLKHKARLQLDIQKLQDGDIDLVKQAKQQYEDNQMSSTR